MVGQKTSRLQRESNLPNSSSRPLCRCCSWLIGQKTTWSLSCPYTLLAGWLAACCADKLLASAVSQCRAGHSLGQCSPPTPPTPPEGARAVKSTLLWRKFKSMAVLGWWLKFGKDGNRGKLCFHHPWSELFSLSYYACDKDLC